MEGDFEKIKKRRHHATDTLINFHPLLCVGANEQ